MTNIVRMLEWQLTHPTGGQSISLDGSSVAADFPGGTTIVHIAAEGGPVYYQWGGVASAGSPGYVPENGRFVEGPIRDIRNLSVFGAQGVVAHIQYYKESDGR